MVMTVNNNVVPLNKERLVARAKLARLPAPVHMLQEKSRQALLRLLQTLFDNADDALFELADKATSNNDQNLFFESMREVRVRRRDLESRFAESLVDAFADVAVVKSGKEFSETGVESFSVDDLALVQNEDLEEVVAVDAMINRANDKYGELIQHLAMRIDSLVPHKIYQKNNPLGPDIIGRAFADGIKSLDADIKAKLVLLKLFDKHVLSQLTKFYQVCNKLLIEQNILPSLKPANAKAASGSRTKNVDSASVKSEVLQALRELLAPQNASGQAANLGSGPVLPPQEIVSALSNIQRHYVLSGGQSVGADLKDAILEFLKSQQKVGQINQVDSDIINLVDMLFEFILDDRTLAAPMKALLGRMQIPILKVAIADKAFFNKGGHPARRLLNEMSTAALGWQDEGKARDPLYEKIESIVHGLLTDFDDDVGVFNGLLTDFISFIEKERRRASLLEQRTLDAEDGKAKAEYARSQVTAALTEIAKGHSLPPVAEKLLHEAWGNVLFLTILKEGEESLAWKNALVTAEDLVWSLAAPIDSGERSQLLKLVPDLLKRLRVGLDSISYNPFEMTALFKALEKLHLQRIRGMAVVPTPQPEQRIEKVEPASVNREVDPAVGSESAPTAGSEDIFADIDAAIEAAEVQAPAASSESASSAADIDSVPDAVEEEEITVDNSYLDQVDKLSQGAWFEMSSGADSAFRCRLAAVLKPTGKFIFVNRSGVKVAEETRVSLAKALESGSLRSLDDGVLFDRALESVISNLRRTRDNTAGSPVA